MLFKAGACAAMISLAPSIGLAVQTHVVDLQVTSHDLANYKREAVQYIFSGAQVRVDQGAWQTSEMKTRGSSSISAPRRNFGIKLPQAVQVENVRSKKIALLSMWIDRGYISTHLGFRVAAGLNIGRIESQYTEVRLNGNTQGIYLMVAKPSASVGQSPYLVRRSYRSRFKFREAETSGSLSASAKARIDRTITDLYASLETLQGSALLQELRSKMDIEAYMKWMAMNSLFKNGDGADEIYFYVDPEKYAQGKIYFKLLPWDFDDLFKSMHSSPINEQMTQSNPNSLIYNYEDKLDLKIARDQVLYSEFKRVVRSLLNGELNEFNTTRYLNEVKTDLAPYLERQDLLDMARLDTIGEPYTKSGILRLFERRRTQINERRAWMLQRTN